MKVPSLFSPTPARPVPSPSRSLRGALPLVMVTTLAAVLGFPDSSEAKLVRSEGPLGAKFLASGPAGMKIEGTTSEVLIADDGTSVTVSVPLANLTTGIKLRDQHMREKYLQVASFPNAELTVPRASLQMPAAGQTVNTDSNGTMKIHGQSRPIKFHYTATKEGNAFRVTGTAALNMNDFGIQVPTYLGVTVKPDITVEVRFSALDQ